MLDKLPDKVDFPVNSTIGGKILFHGFDLEPKELERGKKFKMTSYFKALEDIKEDYQFFGHMEPKGKQTFRHRIDHFIASKKYPTSKWRKGDIIKDVYNGVFAKGFPGTKAVLWSGFFKGEARLGIDPARSDEENRLLTAEFPLQNQNLPKKVYKVYRTASKITIDGKLDEREWKAAASTGKFSDLYGEHKVSPATRAMMLYDDKYLYIGVKLEDEDAWGKHTKRDDPLYREEALEIMIDADGSGSTYYEIQVSPTNVVYDAYFPFRRKNRDLAWDSKIISAVSVNGTVNKRDDKDEGWDLEVAIPIDEIKDNKNIPLSSADKWRLNLFRMERPKRGGVIASMWSPTYVGDFHTLDRFGVLEFQDKIVYDRPKPKMNDPKVNKNMGIRHAGDQNKTGKGSKKGSKKLKVEVNN